MKYNILINQVKSAEWKLTTSEAMLFAWLYELPSWAEKMTYNGDIYFYANRGKACEEMPLVSEKKDTIYRLYKSLQNKNLISFITIKGDDFVSITEKGKKWYRDSEQDSEKNPNDGNSSKKEENNPIDNIYNNKEIDNNKENKDNKLSLSKKDEELPNWKTDFKAYLALVYDAKEKLLANMSIRAKKLEYYPNINYELTIEKMVDDFWGTEEGWKNKIKVSKKSKTIDMVKTLVKGFDYTQNRVYKSIKSSGYGNNYTNTYQQPYNGSNRLIDGENEDGTFNRNGYRYYHSMRDNRDYSIPINAVPMPSFDCEFDINTEKWYHPDIKNDVNGDLW